MYRRYRGFVATNRVSGLMALSTGCSDACAPGNISVLIRRRTRNPSCYTPRGTSNVDTRACIHRCALASGFKALLIVRLRGGEDFQFSMKTPLVPFDPCRSHVKWPNIGGWYVLFFGQIVATMERRKKKIQFPCSSRKELFFERVDTISSESSLL